MAAADGSLEEMLGSFIRARLIPTTGIRSTQEEERRATEALLSVMHAVPDFGRSLIKMIGGPGGRRRRVDTFTEVRLPGVNGDGRPDGAIVVPMQGGGAWGCLVEVKTGRNTLTHEQIERYMGLAREHGFQAVLTISSQITEDPTVPTVVLPRRSGRPAAAEPVLRHLSWWRILSEAVVQAEHRGIEDDDQAWILTELITYLDDPRSGALGLEGMGQSWVSVRQGARAGTLDARQSGVAEVAAAWEELVEYLSLTLYRELGRRVSVVWPSRDEAETRRTKACADLAGTGRMAAELRIADAVAPLALVADLRAQQLITSLGFPAPESPQRAQTKVRWVTRQLDDVEERGVTIEADFGRRVTRAATLAEVRADEHTLDHPTDPRRAARRFTIHLRRDMGTKKGTGDGSFIGDTRRQVLDFYREVVQDLTLPVRKPARLAEPEGVEDASSEGDQDDLSAADHPPVGDEAPAAE